MYSTDAIDLAPLSISTLSRIPVASVRRTSQKPDSSCSAISPIGPQCRPIAIVPATQYATHKRAIITSDTLG